MQYNDECLYYTNPVGKVIRFRKTRSFEELISRILTILGANPETQSIKVTCRLPTVDEDDNFHYGALCIDNTAAMYEVFQTVENMAYGHVELYIETETLNPNPVHQPTPSYPNSEYGHDFQYQPQPSQYSSGSFQALFNSVSINQEIGTSSQGPQ